MHRDSETWKQHSSRKPAAIVRSSNPGRFSIEQPRCVPGRHTWLCSDRTETATGDLQQIALLGHNTPMPGRLESINVSRGGVPKHPVSEAIVGELGLDGDRQRFPYHG